MTDEQKQGMIEMGVKIAKDFGVPVVMLAFTWWLLTKAAMSLHETVLIPIVNSHTQFISQTSETLREIGKTQERQAETLHEIAQGQHEIRHDLGRMRTESGREQQQ
jgi:hypothetical protein